MKKLISRTTVLTAVGLSVLTVAACSSGPDSTADSTTSAAAPSVTNSAAAPPATSSAPANGATQGGATNLQVTSELRTLLGDVYYQATKEEPKDDASGIRRDKVIGPEHVFYGKIAGSDPPKDVFYAMGDTGYTDDPISRQDGPHVWRKRGNGVWEYLGDTGGDFCGKVPQELVRVWSKSCQ
jgi:hypothetical protein